MDDTTDVRNANDVRDTNDDLREAMDEVGICVPEILLPAEVSSKWAVVACDQYTSEPEYWDKVKDFVGSDMSTFHIILPEIFLEAEDKDERIGRIMEKMKEYEACLDGFKGFLLVDRKTSRVDSRKGLVVALDLEKYDFRKGSTSLIRATEGTIVERIPPRIAIREGAPIECPHIMVLIDDPKKSVIEPLFEEGVLKDLEVGYDVDLMMGSGHIKGFKIVDDGLIRGVGVALRDLKDSFRYSDRSPLLYAMGDGNHSFATAKTMWEDLKKQGAGMDHPARYALVELVNVHDAGLEFEPIHRVVFDVDEDDLFEQMQEYFRPEGFVFVEEPEGHCFEFVTGKKKGFVRLSSPRLNLAVGSLQGFLDIYLKKGGRVDYVHGAGVVRSLAEKGNVGFLLPSMDKNDLFKTVILDGALPRKTFSMGDADEKRFYLECRRIR